MAREEKHGSQSRPRAEARPLMLLAVSAVLVVHAAAWWLGGWPLGRERSDSLQGFERQLCGLAILAVIAMGLATAQWLHPPLLIIAAMTAGFLGLLDLLRRGPSRSLSRYWKSKCWSLLPTGVAVTLFLALGAKALIPQFHHDDLTYHLLLPQLYLEAGGWVARPDLLFANMPHLIELLYCWPLAIGGLTAVPLFVLSVSFLVGVSVWQVAASRAGRLAAGVLILAILGGRNVQWHLGPAHIEPLQAAYLFAAVLIATGWSKDRSAGTNSVLLGLFLGVLVASKYTVWPLAALVAAFALFARIRKGEPREAWHLLLGIGGLGMLFLAPWLLKNQWLVGNPLYPNFHSILGGAEWSETQGMQLHRAMESWNGGLDPTLFDRLALLWRLPLADNLYGCPSFSIALMALFLLAVGQRILARSTGRDEADRVMQRTATVAACGLLLWSVGYTSGRFLIPWVPVMALAAVAVLERVRLVAWGLPTLLIAVTISGAYQFVAQSPQPALRIAPLGEPYRDLLRLNPTWALSERLEEIMPSEGRLLSLWENRWLFLDREVEVDSVFEAPRGLARLRERDNSALFAKDLAGRGISHVVIHAPQMRRYLEERYEWEIVDPDVYPRHQLERDNELMRQFVSEELELLEQMGPWGLFALRQAH